MKIIAFKDGLGNQLFQYRLYSFLKSQTPHESIYGYYNKKWLKAHNGLEIFDRFDVEKPKTNILINLLVIFLRLVDKVFPVISRDHSYKKKAILFIGYWQNKSIWGNDCHPIPFKPIILNPINEYLFKKIRNSQSIFIHIRRGDYLLSENSIYNVCDQVYYSKAIDLMNTKYKTPFYFIFSDDIEWVKLNLKIDNAIYVDNNKGSDSFIDMYLMSACKSAIIANSTFSYWGAINGYPKEYVIYPSKWIVKATGGAPNIFKDEWISL